jgi:hypothetical protein
MLTGSPLGPHAATPRELQKRIAAERRGGPFLVYRDGSDEQVIVEMRDIEGPVSVGRLASCTIVLDADSAVSRLHAELQRIGDEWLIVDDGLSRNGTFVGRERVSGRRRLADGDVITVGVTRIAFRRPDVHGSAATIGLGRDRLPPLTPAQRRVLVALCRPLADAPVAAPASNRRIADELVVSPDAVKRTLRSLFVAFGVDDRRQNEKRAALALKALECGAVGRYEL